MVPVATVASPFEARVIAARLGADGIVWQFQGSVDGPLALGAVTVLVSEDDYDAACDLLRADEVAASEASEPADVGAGGAGAGWATLWMVAAVVGVAVFAIARMASAF